MTAYVHRNPFRLFCSLRQTAAYLIAMFSVGSAFAEISMTFNLDRTGGSLYPYINFYADGGEEPLTYHRVESPNGLFYRNTGSLNDYSYGSQTYSDVIDESTDGPWTLTTNVGDPSEEEYTFTVSISGLSEGMFGETSVTNPADYTSVSTNQPLIEWTGTSLFPEIHIQVHNGVQPPEPGNYYTAPAPFNSWTPPSPVLPGTNYIYLAYQTNSFAGITFTTPMTGGGSPLTGWTASADVSSYDSTAFVAPGSNTCSDPFNLAVECPGFTWYTDEYEPWAVSSADYTAGSSSLQSSAGEWGYSYLEAIVQGPAVITFDWALFGSDGDSFEFYSYDDGTSYDEDFFYYEGYDTYGWDTHTVTLSSNDIYYLTWSFSNDDTNAFYPDSAFLDNIRYTYTGDNSNSVSHEAEFEIEIQRVTSGTNTHYLILPRLDNVNPASSLDEVVSPNNRCSGTENSSSSINFSTLQAVIDELQAGPWTIYFDRNGATYEYEFTITVDSLTTNDLAPVLITQPLDGSTGITASTAMEWTGPAGWDSTFAYIRNVETGSTVTSSSLSPATTNWVPPAVLPEATNSVVISYYKNSFSGLSFSHPSSGSQTLTSWLASSRLGSRGLSGFVVGGGIIPDPVTILSPVLSNGNFGLSFVSQSGATHIVEWTPSLTNTTWHFATNFPGDGMTNLVNLPTTNAAAFFRVNTQ
ncbi:hypothetical protein [Pontiella agarivorans]|uniref:P/Homo B domain-containing protein n=1 Tax=Pontiella agarivorans TaxID=3038953 RepID=A0ABU5MVM2_9BACT|nr:hypothetical protein [Pontiella agarivorans]MDZ8118257.1 hypothetical protein [Pontiella agarivorans]